jgi:hypothetical protein
MKPLIRCRSRAAPSNPEHITTAGAAFTSVDPGNSSPRLAVSPAGGTRVTVVSAVGLDHGGCSTYCRCRHDHMPPLSTGSGTLRLRWLGRILPPHRIPALAAGQGAHRRGTTIVRGEPRLQRLRTVMRHFLAIRLAPLR